MGARFHQRQGAHAQNVRKRAPGELPDAGVAGATPAMRVGNRENRPAQRTNDDSPC